MFGWPDLNTTVDQSQRGHYTRYFITLYPTLLLFALLVIKIIRVSILKEFEKGEIWGIVIFGSLFCYEQDCCAEGTIHYL